MPPGKHNQPHNPYSAAAGAYGTNAQKNAIDPREVEARVLLKSAQFMQDLQNDWGNMTPELLQKTLHYNRNVWLMFYDTALDDNNDGRPKTLRSNIYNLANFVFKREMDIMTAPSKEKLGVLININREIAAGLLVGTNKDSANQKAAAPTSESSEADLAKPSGGWDTSA